MKIVNERSNHDKSSGCFLVVNGNGQVVGVYTYTNQRQEKIEQIYARFQRDRYINKTKD